MNGRAFSWEIVLAGVLLTVVAIYINNSADSNSSAPTAPAGAHDKSAQHPEAPEPPELPSIVLQLDKLKELGELESLKKLEHTKNIEELRIKLESLSTELPNRDIDISIKELDEFTQSKDKSKFDVQVKDKEVIIHRSYDVPSGKWAEVSSGVYLLEEPLDENLSKLDLNLSFGNITVTGTDGEQPKLILKASGNIDSAGELEKKLKTQISGGSSTEIQVSSTERFNFFNHINLNAELRIPRNTAVNTQTSGGHITLQNIEGSAHIKTSGGHLKLSDSDGEISGKTSGGHISGQNLSGTISLSTSGGHIKLSDIEGQAKLHTSGGQIELSGLRASVNGKTNGGNISAEIEELPGPIEFSTSAGNINLMLNDSIGADVQLNGSVVNISEAFSFTGEKSTQDAEGSVNGGGPRIEASCNFGNVSLKSLNKN